MKYQIAKSILLFLLLTSKLIAQQMYTVQFDENNLTFNKCESFDIVRIKGCLLDGEPGKPLLPYKRIEILIPPCKACLKIEVINCIYMPLSGYYKLYPAQPPVPLTGIPVNHEFAMNESLYSSFDQYPETCVEIIEERNIAGNKIIALRITPLIYIPEEGIVNFVTEISFKLILSESRIPMSPPSKRTTLSQRHIDKVITQNIFNKEEYCWLSPKQESVDYSKQNPEQKLSQPSQGDMPKDFIIITSDYLSLAFEGFADMKTKRGIIASVVTKEWIKDHYNGRDIQERIRNFIKDAYCHWGISWVLLGGDINVVPTRYAHFHTWQWNGIIPTDLYYADLDGDWDADGDGLFCEYQYNVNIDSVDGNPDIFVGRIPVENPQEVYHYLEKVITYELNVDTSSIQKVLFLGASIYSGGTDGWGAINSEYIIENFLPQSFEPHRLYAPQNDTVQTPPRWIGDELLNRANTCANINNGYNIINHLDHGAYDAIGTGVLSGGGYFHWDDADALTNATKPSILWSISCNSNSFDMNSVSEHFVNSPGGLAYIGNSRTGWTSQMFQNYAFFKSIFLDSVTNLGASFASTLYNSLYYQVSMNLLGDPTIFIWTDVPRVLTVNHKKSLIVPVDSIGFFVSKDGYPVEDARIVLIKPDEDIIRITLTDQEGRASIYLKCINSGKVFLSVSSRNTFPYVDSIQVQPLYEPYLSLLNGDYLLRPGEEKQMSLSIRNTGTRMAENVQAVVSSTDPYVIISHPLVKCGDIPAQTTVTSTKFTITVQQACPPERIINLICTMYDNNLHEWLDTLQIRTGNQSLCYRGHSSLIINSVASLSVFSQTIQVPSIKVTNCGDFTAHEIQVCLKTTNSNVQITDSTVFIDSIVPYSSVESSDAFVFTSSCGLDADFTIEIRDGNTNLYSQNIEFKAPSSVDSLACESKQNSIKITWRKASDDDILGYVIYKNEGKFWEKITEDPLAYFSYEDLNVTPGKYHHYAIATVDSSFNESVLSDSLAAMPNPALLHGWPVDIGSGGITFHSNKRFYDRSSPSFGDIDGDGKYEIIVGSNDNNIYAYNHDGTRVTGWPKNTGFRIENSPAICDIDKDGCDEIIIGGGVFDSISVNIYHGDGSQFLPGKWPKKNCGEVFSSPVIADIDNDTEYEIGMGFLFKVYFWNADGSLVNGWPVDVTKPICIAVADIDNDTETDIVIASSNGTIYSFNHKGEQKSGWPQTPGGQIYSGLALADLDEDGKVEIIVGTSSGRVYVYHSDGTLKTGWPVIVGNRIGGIPAIGDINEDPGLEIAVSTTANQMYVFDHNGELLFSKDETENVSNYYLSPILADINNDGKKDILINTLEGFLYAYNYKGEYIAGFPLFFGDGSYATTAIADIDKDGALNLVLKGSDKKLYVWDTINARLSKNEMWSKARANKRNTCYYNDAYKITALCASSEQESTRFLILHSPFPNPFTDNIDLKFSSPKAAKNIDLSIFDVSGRMIKSFSLLTPHSSPVSSVSWDGKSKEGKILPSGVYFVKMTVTTNNQEYTYIRKITKLSSKQ